VGAIADSLFNRPREQTRFHLGQGGQEVKEGEENVDHAAAPFLLFIDSTAAAWAASSPSISSKRSGVRVA
jgi:hypothetical protein